MAYLHHTPFWLRSFFPGGLLWEMPTQDQEIFLTFDDGPVPEATPQVLDILDQYAVKATFFCVGANVERNPALYHELISRGHGIGNHSYAHTPANKASTEDYLAGIERCHQLAPSSLFRPPHGIINRTVAKRLRPHFTLVMWSVLSGDFDPELSPDRCLKNTLHYTKPGSIIVFHDSIKAAPRMLQVLPEYIRVCQEKGVHFGVIR